MGSPISLDPQDFPETALFSAGPEEFPALDVILATDLRGELAAPIGDLRRGLAALKRLEERGDDVDEHALQHAVDAWRSSRGLESAEETDAWLAVRGIETDDLANFVERGLAAEREASATGEDEDQDEISSELYASLVCSGELDRQTVELARRAAAHAAWVEGERKSPSAAEVQTHAARFRPAVLAASPRHERLVAIESVFDLGVAASLDPDRIARAVEGARLDLLRLDFAAASFETQDAAREAVFCIEDDGDDLEGVARRAGAPVSRRLAFASELADSFRAALLSTKVSRIAGPFEEGGRFLLLNLERKIEPVPDDPLVRARICQRLRDRAFRDEMEARVRWIAWQPSSG
jgi:hypothetical protein